MHGKGIGLALAILLSMLSGCKTMPANTSSANIVSAGAAASHAELSMLQAPADTARYYYAVGEADTVELAKNRALSDIASRISVSISASTYNEVNITRQGDQQETSEQLNNKVNAIAKTIEFAGVTVEKTQTRDGLRYVLVKVDRNILFQSYLEKLNTKDRDLKKESIIFDKSDVFYQLKLSYGIQSMIGEAKELLSVLKAMNPAFNDQVYRDAYAGYEANIRGVKDRVVVSVVSDKNSKSLETLIKRYLSDANIKLSNGRANVNLFISTDAEEKKYKTTSVKLAKMKIVSRTSTLKVKNDKGIVISNNVVKTKAASSISVDDAIQQTKQFEPLIERGGILAFISGK